MIKVNVNLSEWHDVSPSCDMERYKEASRSAYGKVDQGFAGNGKHFGKYHCNIEIENFHVYEKDDGSGDFYKPWQCDYRGVVSDFGFILSRGISEKRISIWWIMTMISRPGLASVFE